jgi:hypothetical protein
MQVIEIDAGQWTTVRDFLTALRTAIGASEWHGWNIDAFIDSMIWGGINQVEPPYEIRVRGSDNLTTEVRDYILLLSDAIRKAREERRVRQGIDTEVSLTITGATIP